jgi:proteic killer suppression protein
MCWKPTAPIICRLRARKNLCPEQEAISTEVNRLVRQRSGCMSSTTTVLSRESLDSRADSLEMCKYTLYTTTMIASFRHKGLQEVFEKGSSARVQTMLLERILRRLDALDAAKSPEALNIPGFDFHGLRGKPKRFSVHVNGPWCITFEWQGEDAVNVDLENYH